MNDLNELCSCKQLPSQPEFACDCGTSIVFLCNLCVASHLKELRPHSLMSIDQAHKMNQADSEFQKRYAEDYRNYSLSKIHVKDYLIHINNFISKIEELRASVINQVNAECDSKIKYLREVEADLNSKFERLSTCIASFDLSELSKYQANERGILEGYPDQLSVNEDGFKHAIGNMINIYDSQSILRLFNTKVDEIIRTNRLLFSNFKVEEAKNVEYEKRLSSHEKPDNGFDLEMKEPKAVKDKVKVIINPKQAWIPPREIIIQKSDLISKLRKKVKQVFNCSEPKLYYNKIELDDWECLDFYGISNGSVIILHK